MFCSGFQLYQLECFWLQVRENQTSTGLKIKKLYNLIKQIWRRLTPGGFIWGLEGIIKDPRSIFLLFCPQQNKVARTACLWEGQGCPHIHLILKPIHWTTRCQCLQRKIQLQAKVIKKHYRKEWDLSLTLKGKQELNRQKVTDKTY